MLLRLKSKKKLSVQVQYKHNNYRLNNTILNITFFSKYFQLQVECMNTEFTDDHRGQIVQSSGIRVSTCELGGGSHP